MQRQQRFQETVYYLRDLISQLEESQRRHLGRFAPADHDSDDPNQGNRSTWAWENISKRRFCITGTCWPSWAAPGSPCFPGHPDVFVPLVLAGEATYLGLLGTHPKFQRYVDAQEPKAGREQGSVLAAAAFDRMIKALPPRQLQAVPGHCAKAASRCGRSPSRCEPPRSPAAGQIPCALQDLQLSGLDRLLWIYLRLLYTQHMLDRFFENTSQEQIESEIERLEDRLARSPATDADDTSPRQRHPQGT